MLGGTVGIGGGLHDRNGVHFGGSGRIADRTA